MVRPTKKRRVEYIPEVKFFKPAGIPKCDLKKVALTIEEIEAIRLKDKERLTQAEAAERMEVSRPTFQRILTKAREKIAEGLIEGKAIKFQGGDYKFKPRCKKCGGDITPNQKRNGHRSRKETCPKCE
ncbi:putative DNA-binding protein [Halobacteroides halobius DSM 5150]|uniref:UPF0251 protein Halha_1078 n=1 Tax=Halobacteroides halobius (strain ATCC 35273 / DSM 5150 / MD-1) TaxID=748449 RepID=L0K9J3_HALHC|nr:DUF134 domain-containing protein [Halobacteroides halobius]AGB41034.1 putative DNA-binding protein [Halobacteroides halobius DSM 5150]